MGARALGFHVRCRGGRRRSAGASGCRASPAWWSSSAAGVVPQRHPSSRATRDVARSRPSRPARRSPARRCAAVLPERSGGTLLAALRAGHASGAAAAGQARRGGRGAGPARRRDHRHPDVVDRRAPTARGVGEDTLSPRVSRPAAVRDGPARAAAGSGRGRLDLDAEMHDADDERLAGPQIAATLPTPRSRVRRRDHRASSGDVRRGHAGLAGARHALHVAAARPPARALGHRGAGPHGARASGPAPAGAASRRDDARAGRLRADPRAPVHRARRLLRGRGHAREGAGALHRAAGPHRRDRRRRRPRHRRRRRGRGLLRGRHDRTRRPWSRRAARRCSDGGSRSTGCSRASGGRRDERSRLTAGAARRGGAAWLRAVRGRSASARRPRVAAPRARGHRGRARSASPAR